MTERPQHESGIAHLGIVFGPLPTTADQPISLAAP